MNINTANIKIMKLKYFFINKFATLFMKKEKQKLGDLNLNQ